METPTEDIKRLYLHRIELGKPVDDYDKRFPELKDEIKFKSKDTEIPKEDKEEEDKEEEQPKIEVKKDGKRTKR